MASDIVGVIESAYRTELSDAEWLAEVAAAARTQLDAGYGVASWTFCALNPAQVEIADSAYAGDQPGAFEVMRHGSELLGRAGRDFRADCHMAGPCITMSQAIGAETILGIPEVVANFHPLGARDMIGVVGVDPTGFGLGIGALLHATRDATRQEVRRWSRVAAHLAAGFRLRRTLASRTVDAVVTPAGKIEHAEEAAKSRGALEALRQAALDVDRARGRLRREDSDDAIETWRGLISGRWTLLDQFESDGKRYLVARQNDPEAMFPPNLTQRERQVLLYRVLGHPLKLIAYELGLSTSTISSTLGSALRKLGVQSVADVIRMFSPGPSS